MSNHNDPECAAPDHLRCEATARGNPAYFYRWASIDRRCSKRAYAFRDEILCCAVHLKAKRDPVLWSGALLQRRNRGKQ